MARYITMEHGTERAFTGATVNGFRHDNKQTGTYVCARAWVSQLLCACSISRKGALLTAIKCPTLLNTPSLGACVCSGRPAAVPERHQVQFRHWLAQFLCSH
jgi:hypothetical protein